MSGSIAEKYGAAPSTEDEYNALPAWVTDPNNIPFSKNRQTSEYELYYRLTQKSINNIISKLEADPSVSQRVKSIFKILYEPQQNIDSLLAAEQPYKIMEIMCDKRSICLRTLGGLFPEDAAKPVVSAAIVSINESCEYFFSKIQQNEYNVGQNIVKEKIMNKTEVTMMSQSPMAEQKKGGILGFLKGGR